jgi:hypothetical protein
MDYLSRIQRNVSKWLLVWHNYCYFRVKIENRYLGQPKEGKNMIKNILVLVNDLEH